jgi:hypothetical protein
MTPVREKSNAKKQDSTCGEFNRAMRKPEGTNGASSGNMSSIGANMSSEQAPTAFSSVPVHSCSNDDSDDENNKKKPANKQINKPKQKSDEAPVRDERP